MPAPATRTENSHSSIKSLFSPLVHNILFYIKVVCRCFTVTRTTSRADGKGWTHVWSKMARVNGGRGGGGNGPGKPQKPSSTEFLPNQVTFCILVCHIGFAILDFWILNSNSQSTTSKTPVLLLLIFFRLNYILYTKIQNFLHSTQTKNSIFYKLSGVFTSRVQIWGFVLES